MICRECRYGRRFAEGSSYCRFYGIIISEAHICTLKGAVRRDGTEDEPYERKLKKLDDKREEKKENIGGTAS